MKLLKSTQVPFFFWLMSLVVTLRFVVPLTTVLSALCTPLVLAATPCPIDASKLAWFKVYRVR